VRGSVVLIAINPARVQTAHQSCIHLSDVAVTGGGAEGWEKRMEGETDTVAGECVQLL
jgi:hypothetical protein